MARIGGLQLRWHARELRGDRTIADAARLVQLNRDELVRIERGDTVQIRFATLAKLLSGYGCGLQDLLEVEPDPATSGSRPLPLYAGVLAALDSGAIPAGQSARRVVRRPAEWDVVPVGDESVFAPSPQARSVRRRRPTGTLNRAR